ncbi:efflux RND transporter periplasmic adaptor subunit [Catenovulum adriaticum]|uniref:Efflux RND transporter periplasmic adaptor subunit n=1 Tax=Catenovulum adriaticum TaxID=2984846 RepID=A0ABY7AI10_9ALTE|nr:efflux RND transporter periplasmic adaptor subunit [Catenovulum sp. TS8]WAJ69245.1 efflux RND transporter periplasmic adaptor subunit [Catenovulum sp. TS8]
MTLTFKNKILSLSWFQVLIAITCLNACQPTEAPKELVDRSIAWMQVQQHQLTQVRHIAGELQPVDFAPLSFQVAGKVEKVWVKLGDKVKAGDKLAQLQPENYQLSLQAAQGNLHKAQANYADKKAEFERFKKLKAEQLVSLSAFDNAKSLYESAKSTVEVATTEYNIARKNLNDTQLFAPYDGHISQRLIEPSQQINVGQTALTIEASNGLEVSVLVPETLIKNIKPGLTCQVTSQVIPNQTLNAQVTEISNTAQGANTFPVILNLTTQNPELKAGMSVEVAFKFNGTGRSGYQGNTVKIPVAALLAGANQQAFVFVYQQQSHTLKKVAVQTENIIDNQVLVSKGIKPGDIIATAGVSFLKDGQSVKLLEKQITIFN